MSRWHVVLLAGALMAVSQEGAAQSRTVRFEIASVGDTTLSFRVGEARWVRPGQVGTAVDPRRRDQMVARFRVLFVNNREATAVVTGQTTAVSTDHVATLVEPRRPWFRSGTFWTGLLVGGAVGAAGVAASQK